MHTVSVPSIPFDRSVIIPNGSDVYYTKTKEKSNFKILIHLNRICFCWIRCNYEATNWLSGLTGKKWSVGLRHSIFDAQQDNNKFLFSTWFQSFRAMSAILTNHLPNTNKTSEGTKLLLKELIGIVKECQTRYGGKTELATEDDQK